MTSHSIAFRFTRTLVAALGGLMLLPGLALLALGVYGLYLMLAPEPPLAPGAMPHNLGQGFDGMLLMMYCGIPGLALGLTGGFLVERARRA
jgi:hypothetical protein